MTPQEAIKYLKIDKDIRETCEADDSGSMLFCEALKLAILALKKQIPKKPIDIYTPVVTWGLCPICKGEFNKLGGKPNRVFKSNAFCPDCGQALDWSNEE